MSSRDIANLKNGLVAAWIPSLGATGYRLVDRVGSNHGVLTNMDAASDWVVSGGSGSLDFDGVNDYVTAPNNRSHSSGSQVTVSCWVRRNVTGVFHEIINKFSPPQSAPEEDGWLFRWTDTNVLRWSVANNATYNFYTSSDANTSTEWIHLAVTHEFGIATKTNIYVNGTAVNASWTQGTGTIIPDSSANNYPINLGVQRYGGVSYNLFSGQLDDIRIYNRALSATEISLLSKERGIGFKTSSRTSSVFAKRYAYKPPKDKTYAAITRSQSDYDSLREGLILAICPSITQGSGYRAPDLSGRGNHGEVLNANTSTFWSNDNGVAAKFDGSDDNIKANPWTYGVGSIAFWVKSTNDNGNCILCIGKTASSTDNFSVWVGGNITGTLTNELITITTSISGQFRSHGYATATRTEVLDGKWHHIAITQSVLNAPYSIYLDGVSKTVTAPVQSTNFGIGLNVASGTELRIGAFLYLAALSTYLDGSLDDVRVYSRALTEPEIRRLASGRGVGLKPTSTQFDYLETREKTYSVIVKSQQEHSSLSEGLVGAWCPSLGATGFRLIDRSGYGNHGTLTNMTNDDWVVSGGAGALDFDGVNDYVDLSLRSKISSTGDFTIAGWVSLNAAPGNIGAIFSQYLANQNNGRFIFGVNSNSKAVAFLGNDASLATVSLLGTTTLSNNLFYHLVVTRKTNTFTVFVNGVSENTNTDASARTILQTGNTIGSFCNSITSYTEPLSEVINGKIDDVRVYSRALTVPEIRRLASGRGVGLKPTSTQFDYIETREKTYSVIVKSQQEHSSLSEGLVGAWCPSLGASGYRLVDRSGYGNHGTLTNMTSDDWVVSGGAGALDFDGTDDYVTGSDSACPTGNASITVSHWVYLKNTSTPSGMFGYGKTSVALQACKTIVNVVAGQVSLAFAGGNNAVGPTISAGSWNHICFTKTPGAINTTTKVYSNGVEQTLGVSSSNTPNIVRESFTLGVFDVPSNDFSPVLLDDCRIYNRALTHAEIRLLASKRGIGLRSQKQTMFYQFPSFSKRRRLLTGMP